MKPPPIKLSTDRLLLRAARTEDAPPLFQEYTSDIRASRFLPRGPHTSQSTTEAVISKWGESNWSNSSRFAWTIIERSSDRPIGLFLLFIEGDDQAEIHFGMCPAAWAHGYATEAGMAVMEWISKQSHLSEVYTTCAASHHTSCRVLEKIGLRRSRLIPGALLMKATGEKIDGCQYIWRRSISQ